MGLAHATTLRIDVEARVAFDFLADPLQLGCWSLGCFDTKEAGSPGLYTGVSLYDGSRTWFRIDADQGRFIVDYHVGDAHRRCRAYRHARFPGQSAASPRPPATLH
jgi:hypothetical protein